MSISRKNPTAAVDNQNVDVVRVLRERPLEAQKAF
jgi:hypothetical protein